MSFGTMFFDNWMGLERVLLVGVITYVGLVRSTSFSHLVKASPTLLFHAGSFLEPAMRAERVTRLEVVAAIRQGGFADLGQVGAVVLETDGSFSILPSLPKSGSSLQNVQEVPRNR